MAYTGYVNNMSFVASGDLSGLQNRFVDILANNRVGHALANKGFGVLLNNPRSGEHATVQIEGQAKVRAGASISVGQVIVSAASGYAAVAGGVQVASGSTLSPTNVILGRALTAAASGSLFSIQLDRQATVVVSA